MYRLDVQDPAFKCILSAVDLKGIEDVGRKGEIEHELINWVEGGEGFCLPSCSDSLTTQESVDLLERPWGFCIWLSPELICNHSCVQEFDV